MPRLMIVDDETIIRKGLSKMLQRVSPQWEVNDECGNGVEAIAIMKQQTIDLVISDIRMPIMDGLEMVQYLANIGFDIPVIFLTGYDEFEYVQRALRYQAFDYLLKPIKDEDIKKVLNRFMQEKFIPVGQSMSSNVVTQLHKFEFEFLNTLETYNSQNLLKVLRDGAQFISEHFNAHSFFNEVIRIANTFFLKHGIYGLNNLGNTHNIPNQIDSISNTISALLDQMKEQREISTKDKTIQRAFEYVKENLKKPITLPMVAAHVYLNPTYFSEYFKSKTGENFIQYLTRLRMEEAKLLLKDPQLKIGDIAVALGYMDARYFSKIFKEFLGITPKEFRLQS